MTPAEIEAAIRSGMQAAQKGIYGLDEEGQAALMRLYEWAARQIEQAIRQHAGADGGVALYQLADLKRQIEARLAQLAAGQESLMTDGLAQAAHLGAQTFAEAGLDAAAAMRVPDEAARFVRAFVSADGLQLSDRLWRIDRGARDAVVNAVERSVIMGHGAAQAAREFLTAGRPVPAEIQDKLQAANATAIAGDVTELLTGDGSGGGAMAQAARVFRTEINRAHGVAYMMQAEKTPGFVGFRFTLSPQHPKPDICDQLAKEDRFGLGEGVFPSMEEFVKVWPAHPNTFSFPVAVFDPAAQAAAEPTPVGQDPLAANFTGEGVQVFGRFRTPIFSTQELTVEAVKLLSGAPDGATVYIRDKKNRAEIEVIHPFFKTPREMFIDKHGVLHWNGFFIADDGVPAGAAVRMAASTLLTASQLGFPSVEMTAWGKPGYNGSYTWARMGFDAPFADRDRSRLEQAGFAVVQSVADLMASADGRAYWKANGWRMEMKFDPTPGSRAMETLARYLIERGMTL